MLWSGVPAAAIGDRAALRPANLGYPPNAPVPHGEVVTLADEAEHLLRAIPDDARPVHLVAHSYGATVALELAEAPSLRGRLASMFLAEPVLFAALVADEGDEIAKTDAEAVATAREMVKHSPLLDEAKGGSLEWLELFIDYWNRPGSWAKMPDSLKQQAAAVGWKMYQEVRSCFGAGRSLRSYTFTAPTTLVMGARTTMHSRAVTNALARARSLPVIELQGTGHMAPLTHPALVHGAIAQHFARLK